MSHIFISYARKDLPLAELIVAALVEQKLKVWIDREDIPKGEKWLAEIYRGIEEAESFLFLISPDSVISPYCRKEIEHAVKNNKRIIPVVLRDAQADAIPEAISERNWIFCRDGWDDFNKAIDETCETIHTDYEWLKFHTKLQVQALEWGRNSNESSFLLHGRELQNIANTFVTGSGNDPNPTELQREYILASQENEDLRRRGEERRRRQIIAGLSIGLAVVAILAIFAWQQRNLAVSEKQRAEEQANIALSRQLIAQIPDVLDEGNWELAMLLAIEAGRANKSPDSFGILRKAIAHPGRTKFIINGVNEATWNLDGSRLLTVSRPDNAVSVWDAETGEKIFTISGFPSSGFVASPMVNALWSPDGTRILTVTEDGSAKIWDAKTGTEVNEQIFSLPDGIISGQTEWSPDGGRILIVGCSRFGDTGPGCLETKAQIWDTNTNKTFVLFTYRDSDGNYIDGFDWNSSGTQILTWRFTLDQAIVWDAVTGIQKFTIPSMDQVRWNKDGKLILVINSGDHTVSVWDADTGVKRFTLSDVENAIWNNDGNQVLTLDSQKTNFQRWDANSGLKLSSVSWNSNHALNTILMNKDGSDYLVSECYVFEELNPPCSNAAIEVWNIETGVRLFALSSNSRHLDAKWKPDGSQILTYSSDEGVVRVWDINPGQEIPSNFDVSDDIVDAKLNNDETHLLTRSADRKVVKIWETKTGRELFELHTSVEIYDAVWNFDESRVLTRGHDEKGDEIIQAWDANLGELLVTLSYNSEFSWYSVLNSTGNHLLIVDDSDLAQVWDLQSGDLIFRFSQFYKAMWSPDGSQILIAGTDSVVQIWDVKTRVQLKKFYVPNIASIFSTIQWNPKGNEILTVTWEDTLRQDVIQLWDTETGLNIFTFPTNFASQLDSISWNPSGNLILIASGDGIQIWSTETGRLVHEFKPDVWRMDKAEWNPAGNRILTWLSVRGAGTVQLWDAQTGKEVGNLSLIKNITWGDVFWEQRGDQFATVDWNDVAWIWNSETGQQLFSLPSIYSIEWNADGSRLITKSSDGIRQWYTDMSDLVSVACLQTPRNMTHAEWNQYIGEDIPYRATCPNLLIASN